MSHTASEPSHGLHFLRLAELIFQYAALGDIFGNHFQNLLSNFGAGDGSTTQPDRDGIAVLALPADLDVLQPCATANFIDWARVFRRIATSTNLSIQRRAFV